MGEGSVTQKQEGKWKYRIAWTGMNEQLVITGEVVVVPVFPGEEEHMQSQG